MNNSINTSNYDLDINKYTLTEIFNIFNLPEKITENDLKNAKKKVYMIHPDKSKLPPEYFIFYKKAYEIVYQYYCAHCKYNDIKQNNEIDFANVKYNNNQYNVYNKGLHTNINEYTKKGGNINEHINNEFETNFKKPVNTSKYDWFTNKEETSSLGNYTGVSSGNINSAFNTIKQKQAEMSLVQYKGVSELYNLGGTVGGTSFYDTDDTDENNDEYISCDLFSKLKYDDLRRVYKDQPVIPVNEHDFVNYKQRTAEEMAKERKYTINPLEQDVSEKLLEQQKEEQRRRIAEKHYYDTLQLEQRYRKMNDASARFLQLK